MITVEGLWWGEYFTHFRPILGILWHFINVPTTCLLVFLVMTSRKHARHARRRANYFLMLFHGIVYSRYCEVDMRGTTCDLLETTSVWSWTTSRALRPLDRIVRAMWSRTGLQMDGVSCVFISG